MNDEAPGLLADLIAEKTRLEADIEASEAEVQDELRTFQANNIRPLAHKIRALKALRSRLVEVDTQIGARETE